MKNLNKFLPAISLLLSIHTAKGQNKFIEYTFQPSSVSRTTHATAVTNGWMAPLNVFDCRHDLVSYVNKNTGAIKYLPTPEDINSFVIIDDIIQTGPNEFI